MFITESCIAANSSYLDNKINLMFDELDLQKMF